MTYAKNRSRAERALVDAVRLPYNFSYAFDAPNTDMPSAQELIYKKSNDLIVMIPSVKELSTLSRKIYTVLLWETQNQCKRIVDSTSQEPSATHTFEARLADLLSYVDEDYKDFYTRAKKCFHEMRRTEVDWKPVEKGIEDAWGNMSLLSQVKIFKRNKEVIAQWALPPEIMRLLINHGLYTLIDLKQIVKLRSYAAIALYEIFARYKTVPGGCTSAHSPEWWTTAISHKPNAARRDWRKVKYETITPALQEISELTDIEVERPEEKRDGPRNSVTEVYFRIRRKATAIEVDQSLPLELIEKAAALDVPLSTIKSIASEYHQGSRIALAALNRLEHMTRRENASEIHNRSAWLRTVAKDMAQHVMTVPSPKAPAEPPIELKQTASDEIRALIVALPREEQLGLLERAVAVMRSRGVMSAQATLKYKSFLDANGGLTPLFLNYMVEMYKSDQQLIQGETEVVE